MSNLSKIIGQPITKVTNTYAYILYLELGQLRLVKKTTPSRKPFEYEAGELTLTIEGLWVVTKNGQPFAKSTQNRSEIDHLFDEIKDVPITKTESDETGELVLEAGPYIFRAPNKLIDDSFLFAKEGKCWELMSRGKT
jgi:hypothetical protein